MIKATVYQNREGNLTGFDIRDHAEYADPGADIVCAAVSALTINCVNSIEAFTDAAFSSESDAETGRIFLKLSDPENRDAQMLLKSLVLGLQGVEEQYNENMDLIIEEV